MGKLFEFVVFGMFYLCNCVVMVLMMCWGVIDGIFGLDVVVYYLCWVEGGVGLIVSEGLVIDYVVLIYKVIILQIYGVQVLVVWVGIVLEVKVVGVVFIV